MEHLSQQLGWYQAHPTVGTGTYQDADALLSTQAARLSVDHEVADSTGTESSDDEEEISKQGIQPAIKLAASVDFSPDQSDPESNEEREEDSQVGIKMETQDEYAAMVSRDPTVFTISLGVTPAADDHRFIIRFNNERVVDGLRCMPPREIWQLVHDAIQQDPDIPNRPSSIPRITDVHQQDDGALAFKMSTEEDRDALSTNVEWARNLRETVSAGIKTYKVVFEFVKIRTMEIEEPRNRASVIDKIREENSEKIPSLNQIGALRDVMVLQDTAFKRERDDYADYILVFGSREAANAALTMGLMFRKKNRACVVYEPGTQWHQQCSHCQGHSHAAKDCQSTPLCGRCGYKHATRYCTSAKIECANCHGEHVASSKKCLRWLKAEEKAHRSYRFPAGDQQTQAPTKAEPTTTTTTPPPLPSPLQGVLEMLNEKAKIALPSPKPPKAASTMPPAAAKTQDKKMPTANAKAQPATSNAILQTIDEFRAFVAARGNGPSSKKRSRSEYVMTGALQDDGHSSKRIKREEEGPVWPIGQKDYRPPSLKLHKSDH